MWIPEREREFTHVKKGCRKQFPSSRIIGAFAPRETLKNHCGHEFIQSRVIVPHVNVHSANSVGLQSVLVGKTKKQQQQQNVALSKHNTRHYAIHSDAVHIKNKINKNKREREKAQPWPGQSFNQKIKLETTGYNQSIKRLLLIGS